MLGTIRYIVSVTDDGENWSEYDDQSTTAGEAFELAAAFPPDRGWKVEVAVTVLTFKDAG